MSRRAVAHVLTPTHPQALAEMVDSIRTRQCNEVRTSVLLKAVLGAEAADEAELTGDLAKWEEHCASVKHAPCNRSWHSLQPRVGHSLHPTWQVEDAFLRVGLDLSGNVDKLPGVKTFLNRMLGVDVDTQAP